MNAEAARTEVLRLFAAELEARTGRIERHLRELAAAPPPDRRDALVDALALEAHNLVGTTRTLGLDDAEAVATGLEALVERIRARETVASTDVATTVAAALRSLAPAIEAWAER